MVGSVRRNKLTTLLYTVLYRDNTESVDSRPSQDHIDTSASQF